MEEMPLIVVRSRIHVFIYRTMSGSVYENCKLVQILTLLGFLVAISQLIRILPNSTRKHCRILSHIVLCSRRSRTTAELSHQCTK